MSLFAEFANLLQNDPDVSEATNQFLEKVWPKLSVSIMETITEYIQQNSQIELSGLEERPISVEVIKNALNQAHHQCSTSQEAVASRRDSPRSRSPSQNRRTSAKRRRVPNPTEELASPSVINASPCYSADHGNSFLSPEGSNRDHASLLGSNPSNSWFAVLEDDVTSQLSEKSLDIFNGCCLTETGKIFNLVSALKDSDNSQILVDIRRRFLFAAAYRVVELLQTRLNKTERNANNLLQEYIVHQLYQPDSKDGLQDITQAKKAKTKIKNKVNQWSKAFKKWHCIWKSTSNSGLLLLSYERSSNFYERDLCYSSVEFQRLKENFTVFKESFSHNVEEADELVSNFMPLLNTWMEDAYDGVKVYQRNKDTKNADSEAVNASADETLGQYLNRVHPPYTPPANFDFNGDYPN